MAAINKSATNNRTTGSKKRTSWITDSSPYKSLNKLQASLAENNSSVISFAFLIFVIYFFTIQPVGNSILDLLAMNNILEIALGFDSLLIITTLGILLYFIYLLYFIRSSGILTLSDCKVAENKYIAPVFYIINIIYVLVFFPLSWHILSNLLTTSWLTWAWCIYLIQFVALVFTLIIYFGYKGRFDYTALDKSSDKEPCYTNYAFIDKVTKESKLSNKHTFSITIIWHKILDFYNYFIIGDDDQSKIKIANKKYSQFIIDAMVLVIAVSTILNLNFFTMIFVELALLYPYLYACLLEIIPRTLCDIEFDKSGFEPYSKNVYLYEINDNYFVIPPKGYPISIKKEYVKTILPKR